MSPARPARRRWGARAGGAAVAVVGVGVETLGHTLGFWRYPGRSVGTSASRCRLTPCGVTTALHSSDGPSSHERDPIAARDIDEHSFFCTIPKQLLPQTASSASCTHVRGVIEREYRDGGSLLANPGAKLARETTFDVLASEGASRVAQEDRIDDVVAGNLSGEERAITRNPLRREFHTRPV